MPLSDVFQHACVIFSWSFLNGPVGFSIGPLFIEIQKQINSRANQQGAGCRPADTLL